MIVYEWWRTALTIRLGRLISILIVTALALTGRMEDSAKAVNPALPTIVVPTRNPLQPALPTAVPVTLSTNIVLDEPWPPLVMTYRETAVQFPRGDVRVQVLRLEYHD